MAEKRKRGQNFSKKDKLVKLLILHKETILNKKTDGATNEAKSDAWTAVTNSFNSTSNTHRSKESLMKVWEKLKSESKLYYCHMKRNTTQTGGGPSTIKVDPVLEQVCAILGRSCTGIIGVPDCDADETGPEVVKVLPKILCIQDDVVESIEDLDLEPNFKTPKNLIFRDEDVDLEPNYKTAEEPKEIENVQDLTKPQHNKTPLWSRRRSQISNYNERSDASSLVSSSIREVYKKKETIEELKEQILRDELEFKKKLYASQLQAAINDVEIKTAIVDAYTAFTLS